MTDVADVSRETTEPERPPWRTCAVEGCERQFEASGKMHAAIYCPEHRVKGARDRKPPQVTVNIGSTPSGGAGKAKAPVDDDSLAQVEANAAKVMGMVAALLIMFQLSEDANDVMAGTAEWAAAVRDVAQYDEFVKKLFARGGMGPTMGRFAAYMKLIGASVAIGAPIANRHGVMPEVLIQAFSLPVAAATGSLPPDDAAAAA